VIFFIYKLLNFVIVLLKSHAKQINFDGKSKSSAVVLNFRISQGNVATQLRWDGNLYYGFMERYLWNLSERIL